MQSLFHLLFQQKQKYLSEILRDGSSQTQQHAQQLLLDLHHRLKSLKYIEDDVADRKEVAEHVVESVKSHLEEFLSEANFYFPHRRQRTFFSIWSRTLLIITTFLKLSDDDSFEATVIFGQKIAALF